MNFTRGDFVRITYADNPPTEGMVLIASPNGDSLMLGFDGTLRTAKGGIYFGMLPVLRDEAGVYRDLARGDPVTIEPREARRPLH